MTLYKEKRRLDPEPLRWWLTEHPILVESPLRTGTLRMHHGKATTQWTPMSTAEQLALLSGRTKRTAQRYLADGIPMREAEDFCDAVGIHPIELWGDDYYGEEWVDARHADEGADHLAAAG